MRSRDLAGCLAISVWSAAQELALISAECLLVQLVQGRAVYACRIVLAYLDAGNLILIGHCGSRNAVACTSEVQLLFGSRFSVPSRTSDDKSFVSTNASDAMTTIIFTITCDLRAALFLGSSRITDKIYVENWGRLAKAVVSANGCENNGFQ